MIKNFKISPFENKTISWWYSRKTKIDMNPPYQRRGNLWSLSDKGYLIDSIINEYDIPKFYIADFTRGDSDLNKRKLPYAIIDGKQRLEAIFGFYDGTVVLNDDFVYFENPSLKLGGLGYKDLLANNKEIADIFETFNLMVVSVEAKNEDPINELFVRLNRSKALTGAEIRNAMSGHAPKLFREISSHDFSKININFAVTRGQDLNASAKLLMFEYHDDMKETTKKILDNFVSETKNPVNKTKLELSLRHVLDTLNDMASIFLPCDNLLNSAGTLPVYYWFVRNIEKAKYPYIRKFIAEFEKLRKDNREKVRQDATSPTMNLIFVEYDNYNRSTNNEQSHKERLRILKENFEYWLKNKKMMR
jgi:hypothetical protein